MATEMKIQLRQVSASTSEATIGRHSVLIDRPTAKGGTDMGPMGGELFLASAGGCFMSNLLAAVRARETNVSGVLIELTGSISDDAPARFVKIDLHVSAESGDRESLEKLVEIADRGCIMMNTLRSALEIQINIEAHSELQHSAP